MVGNGGLCHNLGKRLGCLTLTALGYCGSNSMLHAAGGATDAEHMARPSGLEDT